MIKKYRFGTPIETDAVTMVIRCEEGAPDIGRTLADENGFCFTYEMGPEEIVYGLGEAMRGINKRGGRYVSFNTDQSFPAEDVASLYSSHNFLLLSGEEHRGLFFDYPGRLEFDIGFTEQEILTVTCGRADLYLYVIDGDSPRDVVRQFRQAIGRSYIPPKWAMGFGQSRWGYVTQDDFREIVDKYRENSIPLDAVYMDIDYMEHYKDFTVDAGLYPDFAGFVKEMGARNIHLVPIIDAAVKKERGYSVCDEGLERGYFCTGEDGEPFETAAWPGTTYLPDVLNSAARRWFGEKYKFLLDQGIEGFWNDMNEPSIFYTRESMAKIREFLLEFMAVEDPGTQLFRFHWMLTKLAGGDNYSLFYHDMDGKRVNHELVHNIYGYNMTRAASEAFERLAPERRILIFSRSSYIGMHRYGGIWTGDNGSWWPHLLLNIQQMPSLNMCGFLYAGADIGGFGSNTTRDLLLRWLAFGIFTPLMRNHSAKGTRQQECWRFEHPEDFAHVIGVRYRLLPYLYSELVKAALTGDMYFRPLAFDYPGDTRARETYDQLMLGEGLMVTPVYTQNVTGRYVYLPEDMLFVKFMPDGSIFKEKMTAGTHYIHVELNEVPLFLRKDHILPLASPAQCVAELNEEELELLGWVTKDASYTLYRDDGYTTNFDDPEHYRTLTMRP